MICVCLLVLSVGSCGVLWYAVVCGSVRSLAASHAHLCEICGVVCCCRLACCGPSYLSSLGPTSVLSLRPSAAAAVFDLVSISFRPDCCPLHVLWLPLVRAGTLII